MATGDSNTYSSSAITQSLVQSRIDFNNSLRAVLQNFVSSNAVPTSDNIVFEGTNTTPVDGIIWRNQSTGALYIRDSVNNPSGPYGNFTREGIASRRERSLTSAVANVGTLEPGEFIVIHSDTAGSANNRAYMVTGSNKQIIDIGNPGANSVSTSSIADGAVTDAKLSSALVLLAFISGA